MSERMNQGVPAKEVAINALPVPQEEGQVNKILALREYAEELGVAKSDTLVAIESTYEPEAVLNADRITNTIAAGKTGFMNSLKEKVSNVAERITSPKVRRVAATLGIFVAGAAFNSTIENQSILKTPNAIAQSFTGGDQDNNSSDQSDQNGDSPYDLDGRKTVESAVDHLNVSSSAQRVNILEENMGKTYQLGLNNINKKQNAIDANSTENEMLVAAGLAMASDNNEGNQYGKGAVNFNSKNNRDINAPTGLTRAQEESLNKKFMTSKNAKTYIDEDYDGFVENSSMTNGGEMKAIPTQFVNERVLIREVEGMGKLMFKVSRDSDGKLCLNLVRPVNKEAPVTPPTSSQPERPTTPNVNIPVTPDQPEQPNKPKKPVTPETPTKPEQPNKPKKPVTPETPPETPPEKPPAEEKYDDGVLPGNPDVPADQDPGTPDVEGNAPATPGHSPDHVPTQPQAPAPVPQAPSSEVENRPPAETGQGPVEVDPNGSAQVPGTNNNQGQGGSVDPNGQ